MLLLAILAQASAGETTPDYVGSQACEGCHTYIYRNWQSTRHGSSVMTAAQARNAGYPLPVARRGGGSLAVESWENIAYVIGRRKRIAYIDREGNVLDSAYHHRLDRWGPFPTGKFTDCGSCHFTGPGAGLSAGGKSSITGNWMELNIGCEACHGPGSRHVASLSRDDIKLNATSRVCGRCHTTSGKVLPVDDRQNMHDLVQEWNHDAHATGTRFNSYTEFCAECHAPFQRTLAAATENSSRPVFTEQKKAIGCIGCHNPHELTSTHYTKPTISLQPAVLPRMHTYRGQDQDFTTTDFQEHTGMEELCLQCHRGADRVDLDHADATCTDCHNSYNRNRTLESRVFHDANHPGLSCQPCHRDADHLVSILYGDPEFLAPRNIHNLRTLPEAARQKYGFRYAGGGYAGNPEPAQSDYAGKPEEEKAKSLEEAELEPAALPDRLARQGQVVEALLAREPHLRLGADASIRDIQDELLKAPGERLAYLALAHAYAQRGEPEAAYIADLALTLDAPGILLEPGFVRWAEPVSQGALVDFQPNALAELLRPDENSAIQGTNKSTLLAYLQMRRGDFDEAAVALQRARQRDSAAVVATLYLGLAELGRGNHQLAIDALQEVLAAQPENLTARLGLASALLGQTHVLKARRELENALELEPHNPVAQYLMGRLHLLRGDAKQAVSAFQASVNAEPGSLEVWFQLARSLRSTGNLEFAIRIYGEILARQPADFDSRFEAAALLKLAGDTAAFQLQGLRESPRPITLGVSEWDGHLLALERRSTAYAQLALSEFALAQRARPLDRRIIHQVGDIYRRSGRLDQAYSQFDWLAAREPTQWLHRYRLGTILIEQQRYTDAVDVLNSAVMLAPAEGDLYFALGLALVRAGRLEQALAVFRKGVIYAPFNPGLYTNLGATAGRLEQYEISRTALHRSLELASFPLPRVHLTHTNLALVHLAQGRREAAVTALKSALHAYPSYARAQLLLSRLEPGESHTNTPVFATDAFVFNDLLERFGEITTVDFDDE